MLVRSCLQQLPSQFRTILQLRDLEGFDTATTADLLGVSQSVVKTRLHRARRVLKERLSSGVDRTSLI